MNYRVILVIFAFLFLFTQEGFASGRERAIISAIPVSQNEIRLVVNTTVPAVLLRGEDRIAFLSSGESRLIVSNLSPKASYTFTLRSRDNNLLSIVTCKTMEKEREKEIFEKNEELKEISETATENSKVDMKDAEETDYSNLEIRNFIKKNNPIRPVITTFANSEEREEKIIIEKADEIQTETEAEAEIETDSESEETPVLHEKNIETEGNTETINQEKEILSVEETEIEEMIIFQSATNNTSSAPKIGIFPVLCSSAYYSSYYGMRKDPFTGEDAFHYGIDIYAAYNTSVAASHHGEVVFAGWRGDFGKKVKVLSVINGQNFYIIYAHLNSIDVEVSDRVSVGEIIGKVGSTGRATGPHLHYEVRDSGGGAINPLTGGFLPK